MKYFLFLLIAHVLWVAAFPQNVGIGTSNPQNKLHVAGGLRLDTLTGVGGSGLLKHDANGAVYGIKFTGNSGDVLKGDGTFGPVSGGGSAQFPLMTTTQRDAISNPSNGYHIFNIDEQCLNYYNSVFNLWMGYCDDVKKVVTIRINANASAVDFYNLYAKNYPGTKNFILIVQPGVNITSGAIVIPNIGSFPRPAILFQGMPAGSSIKIINYGNIVGAGGSGGNGPWVGANSFNDCAANASNGIQGGDAIETVAGISITVDNFGIIAGGGGGGGGGGRNSVTEYGGGGGGGAAFAPGGSGGGTTRIVCLFNNCSCSFTSVAQNGNPGLLTTGGAGGAGASNGGNGGSGGDLGIAGQNGVGTNAGLGGLPGRAVFANGGASGIIINNLNGGQVFGVVQ